MLRATVTGAGAVLAVLGVVVLGLPAGEQARAADVEDLQQLQQQADCEGCDFSGAELAGWRLQNQQLMGSNFNGADLRGARIAAVDLSGANLSDADLSGAVIQQTSLQGANLTGAVLAGTVFYATDLSGAQGLSQAQLGQACDSGATSSVPYPFTLYQCP